MADLQGSEGRGFESHLPPITKQEGVEKSTPFVFIVSPQIYLQGDTMKTKRLRSNFLRSYMEVPLRRAEGRGVKRSALCARSSQSHLLDILRIICILSYK